MQHLEGSGTPVLYIGRKVLKGLKKTSLPKKREDTKGIRHTVPSEGRLLETAELHIYSYFVSFGNGV